MYEIPLRTVTTVALFRAQASPYGVYGGQNGNGTCLLRVLGFPLVITIPVMPHIHHSSNAPYHSSNAPYSSFQSYSSDDVYELNV
jgi:hypothetical protein